MVLKWPVERPQILLHRIWAILLRSPLLNGAAAFGASSSCRCQRPSVFGLFRAYFPLRKNEFKDNMIECSFGLIWNIELIGGLCKLQLNSLVSCDWIRNFEWDYCSKQFCFNGRTMKWLQLISSLAVYHRSSLTAPGFAHLSVRIS